jgi:UDP-N-acetylmuramate dehydrogenase
VELKNLIKGKVSVNESLERRTSLHIGGAASYWVEPADREDLKKLLQFIKEKTLPCKVFGKGSNLLVRDSSFPGVVINLETPYFQKLAFEGEKVVAGAGVSLPTLISECARYDLGGLEFAAGIPGTVGGALIMNAGGRDGSIGSLVNWVEVMSLEGNTVRLGKDNLEFGYRRSNLAGKGIILEAELCLQGRETLKILSLLKESILRRGMTQPISQLSAGSTFKNPSVGSPAGELIERCGLKGLRVGDAEVSSHHANFIVNLGAATAADILSLIDKIQLAVFDKYGVKLELEIEVI